MSNLGNDEGRCAQAKGFPHEVAAAGRVLQIPWQFLRTNAQVSEAAMLKTPGRRQIAEGGIT